MQKLLRELFRELADVPPEERQRILAERCVSTEIRAELESLLSHDTPADESLTRLVSDAAGQVLHSGHQFAPRHFGHYRVVRLLGSGGMGTVYLAERHDGEIEQKVAIKLLRPDADRPAWRERFLRERQLLAYLNHASIARLLDAGHAEERPYLVMEYVDGVAIDEYAARIDLRSRLKLFLLVCAGVAHAHRHLVIHRDLKPSNILVDTQGHPKLLDFGIAKLLDVEGDETQTIERLLTPNYASPEQLRGDPQTTATDIYSLGAVLYTMVTGRSPREQLARSTATNRTATGGNITAPSSLDSKIPRDIDFILRKALREEPDERYASVDAFANDVTALLDSRPVQARAGDAWYRTRKFLRRSWMPVSAVALAITGLSLGIWIANRQRAIAERRFNDVHQLSNKLFDVDQQVRSLPGAAKLRQLLVDTSLEYLRRLAVDVGDDPVLSLDVGTAYMRVGRVQGVPISPNLGQMDKAEENLQVAEKLVDSVLKAQPANRIAMLRAAQIAHDRMVLAEYRRPDDAALPLAFRSEDWLSKYLATGKPDEGEKDQVLLIATNVANWYSRKDLADRALQLLRRNIELAKSLDQRRPVAGAQVVVARILRSRGDLEQALTASRDAIAIMEGPSQHGRVGWNTTLALSLSTHGSVLGEHNAVSLGRPQEAAVYFERAFRITTELANHDPNDANSRLNGAVSGLKLADVLHSSDARRSVAVYDEVLKQLGEVGNNSRARRAEIQALVRSTYPLRQLGRSAEARRRLDSAFALLAELKLYPAETIEPGSEPDDALRALAEYTAGSGSLAKGIETYQQLLERILASKPKPESELSDANDISNLYASVAGLYTRTGKFAAANEFQTRRLDLWQQWDRKLPNNSFVRRQLSSNPVQ